MGLFMGLEWQAQRPMRHLKQFEWALVVELQERAWKVVLRILLRKGAANAAAPIEHLLRALHTFVSARNGKWRLP